MALWTEEQIEAWLTSETRMIPFPDGSQRPFTATHLRWERHDYLMNWYTEEDLVALALEDAVHSGYSFELAYPNLIAYAYTLFYARHGELTG